MAVGVNIVSTFNSKGIDRAIKDFQKLDGAGNKAAYSLRTFDKALTNGAIKLAKFGAATAVVGGIIAKSLIQSASNLQESISKINAVFGSSSKTIIAWSETTAKALGISQQTALEAAGTYGNLFQAFGIGAPQAQEMSIRLVELAADMASFNNVPIDDALLALRSGLSGETEPLKRFGVALNDAALKNKALEMGLISTTKGTLPQAIKTQAAYALILEQTSIQQGDVARTSDGVAFKMKSFGAQVEDIKSKIGTALIPIFSALMSFLNDRVIPVFQEFADILGEEGLGAAFRYLGGQIVNAIGGMGAFGNTMLVLVGAFVTLRTAVIAYNATIAVLNVLNALAKAGFLGTTVGVWALNAAMIANPIGLVVAGIVALIAVIAIIIIKFKAVRDAIANAFGWLGQLFTGFKKAEEGANAAATGINRVNAAFEGLTKKQLKTYDTNRKFFRDSETGASRLRLEIAKGTGSLEGFSSATSGSAKTTETAKEKLGKYIDALKGMSSAQKSARDADKSLLKSRTSLADATLKLTDAQAYFNQVVAGYGANSKQAKDRQLALRKAQGAVERAGYDVESSVFAVTQAEKDLAAVRLDPESSPQAIREAEISLAEAKLSVKDATDAQVEATDALTEAETLLDEAINGAKEGSDAYTEALDKLNDAKKAQVDATDAVTEAIERQTEAVDRLREAEEKAQAARVGVNAGDATAAETKVGVTPPPAATGGLFGSFMEAVRGLHPNSSALKSSTPVTDARRAFPKLYAEYKAKGLAMAQGGIITKPTQVLAGEAGAEAIIPLDKLQSGMTVNVTINAGMGTDAAKLGDEIVDVLTRYQRRNGALPLKVA
jgi:hypothetical protein